MKNVAINFAQALLSGIGLLWMFFEAYYSLEPADVERIGFLLFLFIGGLVGCFWFLINGFFVSGFLKQSISISSNAFDTTVKLIFGDIFAQDGLKAIGVNEFFDSEVDELHVATSSLHGIMLTRYWAGNTANWDKQISDDLSSNSSDEDVVDRKSPGKPRRFSVGTTGLATKDGNGFLCVALTRTCVNTMEVSANSDDLQKAMRGLLSKARSICSGRPLCIPLLGSGLARTGIKPNIIVDLILLAIFEESKRRKITNEILIVLPRNMKARIDLATIHQDWR